MIWRGKGRWRGQKAKGGGGGQRTGGGVNGEQGVRRS